MQCSKKYKVLLKCVYSGKVQVPDDCSKVQYLSKWTSGNKENKDDGLMFYFNTESNPAAAAVLQP